MTIRDIYLDYSCLNSPPPASFTAELRKSVSRVNDYPDTTYAKARSAVAKRYGLKSESVCLGNGEDELIDLITRAYGQRVLIPTPTFGQYASAAKRARSGYRMVDCLGPDGFCLERLEPYLASSSLVWICNPNNPLGLSIPLPHLFKLARQNRALIVVDEACLGFSKPGVMAMTKRLRNVLVLRTFSKNFGLAGLRIGYAVGASEHIARLESMRQPFNVNRLAELAVPLAFKFEKSFQRRYEKMVRLRESFTSRIKLLGFDFYPSQTGFVTLRLENSNNAKSLFRHLASHNIHTLAPQNHEFSGMPPNCLRITIGSPSQMQAVLKSLRVFIHRGV